MSEFIISGLLLFVPAFCSGMLVFFIKVSKPKLKLLLAFSGAYLLSLCFLHLLPEIFEEKSTNPGLYILVGFFIQLLLEFFSTGIEHGHIHHHKQKGVSAALLFGLFFHSFLEGLPVAEFNEGIKEQGAFLNLKNSLIAGIVLHNIPIAIAFVTMSLYTEVSKGKIIMLLFLFALMAPLGSLMYEILKWLQFEHTQLIIKIALGVVVGIFLHISTTIMFESSENHKYNLAKMISILFGALLAYAIA